MGYCLEIIFGQSEIRKFLNGEKFTNYEKIINRKNMNLKLLKKGMPFIKK